MRIWLDDVRPMPAGFDIHCTTALACITLVGEGVVDYISFDNDLGLPYNIGFLFGKIMNRENDGVHVAKFIETLAQNSEIGPIGWDIHSANPPARKVISQTMESAERYWTKNIFTGDE
jgi:hypothetical protein